jgi:hypothetical protein
MFKVWRTLEQQEQQLAGLVAPRVFLFGQISRVMLLLVMV